LVIYFVPYLPIPSSQIDGEWTSNATTHIAHLSRMFAGCRGTVRWYLDPVGFKGAGGFALFQTATISRGYGNMNEVKWLDVTTAGTANASMSFMPSYLVDGWTKYKAQYEPIIIDIPYQNYTWYYRTMRTNATTVYGAFAGFFGSASVGPNLVLENYVSAGEDFQFVIYNGPPIIIQYTLPYV
jgi:hypothetical protein